MVKRGPNVVGLVVMAAVYWGALFYWIKDDLQSNIAEDQTRAVILFATSIPYVAYVIWGTMSDLPEGLSEIPFIGKYLKLYTWLAIVLALAYWGWVDTAAVGFLLVGVAVIIPPAAGSLTQLMFGSTVSLVYLMIQMQVRL